MFVTSLGNWKTLQEAASVDDAFRSDKTELGAEKIIVEEKCL